MRHRILAIALGLGVVLTATAASALAGPSSSARSNDVTLNLVAYSTPREAYGTLIPMFQKTPEGDDVSFTQSYGASGDQARAVKAGLKADIVALSLAPDVDELVKAGLVNAKWKKQSYKGIVHDSLVVFMVRDGNPKKIKGWNDLLRPGVEVVTPNPFTSGGARWNVMAAYGAWRKTGKTDKQAIAWLQEFYKNNVVAQESSGSNATNAYLAGRGDVLLTFESEAINGKIPYVIPKQTMLIDIYIAALDKSPNKDEWNKFSQFLKTYPAQKILAENGYRPVNKQALQESRKRFPVRPGETKITDKLLGGWRAVDKKWFDPNKSIMQRIEESLGVPTG